MGIHHRKITPLWPRANVEVEHVMKTIAKNLQTSITAGICWKTQLTVFLQRSPLLSCSSAGGL